MDNMERKVHLGDNVGNELKNEINNGLIELIKTITPKFFVWLTKKTEDLPGMIKQLCNDDETEQKIATLWSEYLSEENLVPKGYKGLSDNFLISNFHQDGYLAGLYVGYVLAMMSLVDNGASRDVIISIRDYIRPNLVGHHYDDREEFIVRYKDCKYSWIDKAKGIEE